MVWEELGVWEAWAELEVSAEPAVLAGSAEPAVLAELAAIVHPNCPPAAAEHGSTTLRIAEAPHIGTVPLQTGLGARRAGTHSRIARPAPASRLAARAEIFPAPAEEAQA